MSEMKTTIVIATADRPNYVLDCLRSMKGVGTPPSVEVLIVDAGLVTPVDVVTVLAVWPNVRVVKSLVRNAGLQRNSGVKKATGDIIVFLDDDTIVQPGWWPAIIKPLLDDCRLQTTDHGLQSEVRSQRSEVRSQRSEVRSQRSEGGGQEDESGGGETHLAHRSSLITHHRKIACVAGAVWCNPSPTFTDKRGGYINWRGEPMQITHRSEKAPVDVDWPMTTNMAIRKDVFCDIGGFPSVYGIYDEDVDLGLKIRRAGWGIRFIAQAAVYHTYLLRPARIPTKQFMFLLGRNRSILLMRHFGLSGRLLMFMVSGPLIQGVGALGRVLKKAMTNCGHVCAYIAGMCVGVIQGARWPVGRDREEFNNKKDTGHGESV